MWEFLGTVVVGGFIGWVASIIGKTSNQMGCLWNIVVGVVGAAGGRWIASEYFNAEIGKLTPQGILIGLAGAVVLIFLLRMVGVLKANKKK